MDENIYRNDELKHWGILGMHWGVRRYQNPDGTLTPEGRERYGVKTVEETRRRSYAKKYEVLKNKGKNRTEKEEKYFNTLKRGREYFENIVTDPSKNEPVDLFSKKFWSQRIDAQRYLEKTNYGERQEWVTVLLGWPISALLAITSERPAFNSEIANDLKKNKK